MLSAEDYDGRAVLDSPDGLDGPATQLVRGDAGDELGDGPPLTGGCSPASSHDLKASTLKQPRS